MIGLVLYDGSCGACSRWVPFWSPTLRRIDLGVAALQDPGMMERLNVAPEDLLSDIRILFTDGGQLAGADAYRFVMRRVWWAYPMYLISIAPLARSIFDSAYRAFARHRHQISASCGLGPTPIS